MIKVDLLTDIDSPSGYSTHAREVIKALHPLVDLKLVNHKHDRDTVVLSHEDQNLFRHLLQKQRDPDIRIQFETPEFFAPSKDAINIGFTQWETTGIPDTDLNGDSRCNWVTQMNRMDRMWTGCSSAATAFKDTGVTVPVDVVLGPVDTDLYRPGLTELPLDGITEGRDGPIPRAERPIVIAMMAQWTIRKNVEDFLITVFSRFHKKDVRILLKTYFSSMDSSQSRLVQDRVMKIKEAVKNPNAPGVTLVTEKFTDEQIAQFYSSVDIYVNTSRGEGLCMPLVQAMTSECFVISNSFSSPSDFIYPTSSEEAFTTSLWNGLLVRHYLAPAVGMTFNPWYRHDQWWGEIDCYHLAQRISEAIYYKQSEPETYNMIRRNARKTIVDKMSPKAAGQVMLSHLEKALASRSVTPG